VREERRGREGFPPAASPRADCNSAGRRTGRRHLSHQRRHVPRVRGPQPAQVAAAGTPRAAVGVRQRRHPRAARAPCPARPGKLVRAAAPAAGCSGGKKPGYGAPDVGKATGQGQDAPEVVKAAQNGLVARLTAAAGKRQMVPDGCGQIFLGFNTSKRAARRWHRHGTAAKKWSNGS
jgi:hypothetical protein